MTVSPLPPMPGAAGPRKHVVWIVLGSVAAGTLILLGLAVVGLRVVRELSPPRPPYHPESASWQYGLRLMNNTLYGRLSSQDVTAFCTRALRHPRSDTPAHFDLDRAVEGCRYGEWANDN